MPATVEGNINEGECCAQGSDLGAPDLDASVMLQRKMKVDQPSDDVQQKDIEDYAPPPQEVGPEKKELSPGRSIGRQASNSDYYQVIGYTNTSNQSWRGHDSTKCSDVNSDCCASASWGEPQTCADGYVPTLDRSCEYTQKVDCKNVDDNIGWRACYGCFPPFLPEPNRSHCTDWGSDCCASSAWGEPQTCVDNYAPVIDPYCQANPRCKELLNGNGCFVCVPTVHDPTKCADAMGNDCCAHEDWGEPRICSGGYLARPDSTCELTVQPNCKNIEGGKGCYGCFPNAPLFYPMPFENHLLHNGGSISEDVAHDGPFPEQLLR